MTIVNPATQPQDKLNQFTRMIVEYDALGWDSRWVRLRNGDLVQPVYKEAEDDTCEDAFFAEGYRYCRNLDGTSVTRCNYDMMEIVYRD